MEDMVCLDCDQYALEILFIVFYMVIEKSYNR